MMSVFTIMKVKLAANMITVLFFDNNNQGRQIVFLGHVALYYPYYVIMLKLVH